MKDDCEHVKGRVDIERTIEFHEGSQAYLANESDNECPYVAEPALFGKERDTRRYRWLRGYYWAKANKT